MSKALEQLIGLLDLETIEANVFRGYHPPDRRKRLFGGQIIAQALVAACRTVDEDRVPHSLHAYFLRPGSPDVPAVFEVERIRDGRSFNTRRIVVVQNGKAIFNMDVSFQVVEEGLSHQIDMTPFPLPDIDKLPAELKRRPFLSYREDNRRLSGEEPQDPVQHVWIKANGEAPTDLLSNFALLAYQSDEALLGTARLPHRGQYDRERMQVASLDHAIWFHKPLSVNEWLMYSLDSPAAGAARGYTRGTIYTAEGELVASCMQEGLIRNF